MRIKKLCRKKLDCGHQCNGVKDEECVCLQC